MVRFSCRLVVRDRFFGRLGLLLGSFLGAPGVVLVLFRHFNSSLQPFNSSTRRFNPSTHQPINSSIQPINSSIQLINSSTLEFWNSIPKVDELSTTRPGGLRAVRLSAATRRVGACLDGSSKLSSNSSKSKSHASPAHSAGPRIQLARGLQILKSAQQKLVQSSCSIQNRSKHRSKN